MFLIFRECQPRIVLSLFLIFCEIRGSCSYKIVLITKKECTFFSCHSWKINLIYLLWKSAIHKSIFNSRAYFIKLFKGRKVLSFAKAQPSLRHQIQKLVFAISFLVIILELKKLQIQSWKSFTCVISLWKCFTNFLQFLVL